MQKMWVTCCYFSLINNHEAVDVDFDDGSAGLFAKRALVEVGSGDTVKAECVTAVDEDTLIVGSIKAQAADDDSVVDTLFVGDG